VIADRGRMFNQIGREVGDAFALSTSRRQQLALAQRRLQTAAEGAKEEINRTRAGEGLPLEVINSVDLLVEAREAMIRALIEYNLSQFRLFVAIGQTPDVANPDPVRADKTGDIRIPVSK
jgi:outer membrane protein TolC